MEEVFPVGSGVVLGLVIANLVPARFRVWVLGGASALLGVTASWISGELAISGLYLPVDIGQVAAAGAMTWILAARWGRAGRAAAPRDA